MALCRTSEGRTDANKASAVIDARRLMLQRNKARREQQDEEIIEPDGPFGSQEDGDPGKSSLVVGRAHAAGSRIDAAWGR